MNTTGFGVIGTGIVGGAWHAHVYHHLPQCGAGRRLRS